MTISIADLLRKQLTLKKGKTLKARTNDHGLRSRPFEDL